MRTEDFFKSTMEQILGLDRSEIDKYFKQFRRNFKNVPSVLASLDEKIYDQEGTQLKTKDIDQEIDILKYHLENNKPILQDLLASFILRRIQLFTEEIKLQIEFVKQSFSEYENENENEKNKEPINTKKIFQHIHHFSVHVANTCKLYDKLIDFMPIQFNDDSEIDSSLTKELRNHLEHFEERLEAWIYLHIGKPYLDMNIINSSTKGIKLEDCLRVLEVDKDLFHILGESYSIQELQRTVIIIENKMFQLQKWANHRLQATAKRRA